MRLHHLPVPTVGSAPKRLDAASVPTVGVHPKRHHQALLPTVWVVNLRVEAVCEWFAPLRKYEDFPKGKTSAIQHVFGNVGEDGKGILCVLNPRVVAVGRCFAPSRRYAYVPKGARKPHSGRLHAGSTIVVYERSLVQAFGISLEPRPPSWTVLGPMPSAGTAQSILSRSSSKFFASGFPVTSGTAQFRNRTFAPSRRSVRVLRSHHRDHSKGSALFASWRGHSCGAGAKTFSGMMLAWSMYFTNIMLVEK